MAEILVSVIIPARNEMPLLWATINSLLMQRKEYEFPLEIIVVNDGSTDGTEKFLSSFSKSEVRTLQSTGVSPAHARKLGAASAKGKYLLFIDAHVILSNRFWERRLGWGASDPDSLPDWLAELETDPPENVGVVHFPMAGNVCDPSGVTHYELTLAENFWGTSASGLCPERDSEFTEIACCGHGCFLVPAAAFSVIDGYGLPFRGYASEEAYFDLRAAMMGYRVYTAHHVPYYHCPARTQNWQWTNEEVFANTIMGAFVLGGRDWADRIADHQLRKNVAEPYRAQFTRIFEAFVNNPRLQELQQELEAKQKHSLVWVLNDYAARNIPR